MAEKIGSITINITDEAVTWDSEFELPEVIFWLETIKTMVINQILNKEEE